MFKYVRLAEKRCDFDEADFGIKTTVTACHHFVQLGS